MQKVVNIPGKGEYVYERVDEVTIKVYPQADIHKTYLIELLNGGENCICSCPGYGFRRRCSHIDNLPAEFQKAQPPAAASSEAPSDDENPLARAAKTAFLPSGESFYDHFWKKDKDEDK